MARREARALFDLCAGFVYSQTLAACIELDLFETLAAGPLTAATLAARAGMTAPAMETLLNAAASLRLLAKTRGQAYRLGRLGAASRGNPGIAAIVRHHQLFYADLADPVALLRGATPTRLSQFWPYHGCAGDAAGYSAIMAESQPMVAAQIFGAYDFARHRAVLDVGGGDGSFLAALSSRAPHLQLALFDLPAVAALAAARLAAAGLTATVTGGRFPDDALPTGADIITLVRVLHDHGDEAALHLLRAARLALPPSGTLLVAEPMAGVPGAGPVAAAYFGFYLLAMGSGRPRTAGQLTQLIATAGFGQIRAIPTPQPLLTGLLKATVSFS